jgi:hypothetical protein
LEPELQYIEKGNDSNKTIALKLIFAGLSWRTEKSEIKTQTPNQMNRGVAYLN